MPDLDTERLDLALEDAAQALRGAPLVVGVARDERRADEATRVWLLLRDGASPGDCVPAALESQVASVWTAIEARLGAHARDRIEVGSRREGEHRRAGGGRPIAARELVPPQAPPRFHVELARAAGQGAIAGPCAGLAAIGLYATQLWIVREWTVHLANQVLSMAPVLVALWVQSTIGLAMCEVVLRGREHLARGIGVLVAWFALAFAGPVAQQWAFDLMVTGLESPWTALSTVMDRPVRAFIGGFWFPAAAQIGPLAIASLVRTRAGGGAPGEQLMALVVAGLGLGTIVATLHAFERRADGPDPLGVLEVATAVVVPLVALLGLRWAEARRARPTIP